MVEAKKERFARDNWSTREPGLFKLEFEGIRGIALCKHVKSISYNYRTIKIIKLIYLFAVWE